MRVPRLTAALLFALPAGLAAHRDHSKPEPPRPLDGLGASAAFDARGVPWAVTADSVQRTDALAVDREGRVYVAWTAAAKPPAVRYAVSHDRGASFRGDFKVADDACAVALFAPADGSVVALWQHGFAKGMRDQALANLAPDGRLDESMRRATFDQAKGGACDAQPRLAQDARGTLHAVWPRTSGGASYGRLRDGGVDAVRGVGSAKAASPDLAITGQRLALAGTQDDGERSTLVAMRSDDGGTSWRRVTLSSTAGAADQPRILVREGRFHVFWNTRATPRTVHSLP